MGLLLAGTCCAEEDGDVNVRQVDSTQKPMRTSEDVRGRNSNTFVESHVEHITGYGKFVVFKGI